MSDGMRFIEMLAAAGVGTQPLAPDSGWMTGIAVLVLMVLTFILFGYTIARFFPDVARGFVPAHPAPVAAAIRGPLFPPDPKPAVLERLRAAVPGGPLPLCPTAAAPGAIPAPEKSAAPQPVAPPNSKKPTKAKPPVPEKRAKKPPEPIQPEPEYIPDETPDPVDGYAMALAELAFEIEQLYRKNMIPRPQKYDVSADGINVFYMRAVQQVSQHNYTEAFNMLTELLRAVRTQARPDRGIHIFWKPGHWPPPPGPWQEMRNIVSRLGCRTLGHKIHRQRAEAAFGLNFKDLAIKEWDVAAMMEEREEALVEMVTGYK
jgi:hypothetical protein